MSGALKSNLLSSNNHCLWNMYGPTETCVWSSVVALHAESNITLGQPISNTQFYILNPILEMEVDGVWRNYYKEILHVDSFAAYESHHIGMISYIEDVAKKIKDSLELAQA